MDFPPPLPDDTQPIISPQPMRRYLPLLAVLAGVSLVLLIALALLAGGPPPTVSLTLIVDGQPQTVETAALTVAELLGEHDIALAEGDTVTPALSAPLDAATTVRVNHARSVTLVVDGQSRQLRTHQTNPAAILDSVAITIADGDRIIIDGTRTDALTLAEWPVPVSRIVVQRSATLHIVDGSTRSTIETLERTVGDALFAAGIELYLADRVTPDLDTPVRDGLEVFIQRSRPVIINADGVTLEARALGGTVADALAEVGLTLVGLDYTIPAEDIALQPGMRIRVIRVYEEVVVEESSRPYETVFQADPALELDQRRVIQAGQPGIIQTTTRIRFENGIEISREQEETVILQDQVDEVIAYGTNVVLRTVETPDGPRQYWRRIRMYATSYHPEALGGDDVTATGRTLTTGIIASDPDIIAYGSEVYVAGYGVGLMADTGGPRTRLWIDLGYSDADWVPWSRWVDVYLLAPPPANIPYLLPDRPN